MWSFLTGSFLAALSLSGSDEAAEEMRKALGLNRRLDWKKKIPRTRSLLQIWDDRQGPFWIVVIADGYVADVHKTESSARTHANELFLDASDDEVEVYCVDGMTGPLKEEILENRNVDPSDIFSVCKENSLSFKVVFTANASEMNWEDLPAAHKEKFRDNRLEGVGGQWLGGDDEVFYFLTDDPRYSVGHLPDSSQIAGSVDPNTTFKFQRPGDDPPTHRVSFVLDGVLRDIDSIWLSSDLFEENPNEFSILDPSLEGFDPLDAAREWYREWSFPRGRAFGLEIDEEEVWFFSSGRAHGRTTPKVKIVAVEPINQIGQ